jgi:alpha-galactosidase
MKSNERASARPRLATAASMRDGKRIAIGAVALFSASFFGWSQAVLGQQAAIANSQVSIALSCGLDCLWSYQAAEGLFPHHFAPPTFEVDGKKVSAEVRHFAPVGEPIQLNNGVTEYSFEGTLARDARLHLRIEFQVNDGTPVIRFQYLLKADQPRTLTAASGANNITYLQTSFKQLPQAEEVELSNFAELTHSYELTEKKIADRYFADSGSIMGPILAATDGQSSFLLAYEHGSTVPDAFFEYRLTPSRSVSLNAVKGNYYPGQIIDSNHPYKTVWFETAAQNGNLDRLASTYRKFVLKYLIQNTESRKPYIFYNTWNFQERNKFWNNKTFLDSMNEDRMLNEIDVAHRMGVEVFVLDSGWYDKAGDWSVSRERFPNGLKPLKAKLDSYGMKLGLWFGPTFAETSSRVVREHPEWRMSKDGIVGKPRNDWGPQKNYEMCLVSGYADALADQLIRVARETGVIYFKWDGVDQYGCSDPHHHHGSESNTHQERADSYGFQLIQSMSHIADKVAAAVPGTIVDFDVTEGGRAMGLGFLSSGKFFLINNGPYYDNYDIPIDWDKTYSNIFVKQGQARTWITRTPLTFDKWIPSVLFLTHYFPDDPQQWQEVDVASLILGQDAIWGDLLNVSAPGVDYIGSMLARYKQVRDDMTQSDPVVTGVVSGSPEIHEKISAATGRGAVVFFATRPGVYRYITTHKVTDAHWTSDGVAVMRDSEGRARIEATFEKPGAKILFFGVL